MDNLTLPQKLDLYKAQLIKWSRAVNLVAPSTLSDIDGRHFQDSLQLLDYIPAGATTLFDFGSGAGFPALPIAMARRDLAVHMFESDQKKCTFLQNVSRETMTPVQIHNKRIESIDFAALPHPDVITARALASLTELITYARPCWTPHPNCVLIFLKGEKWEQELADAQKFFTFEHQSHFSHTNPAARVIVIRTISRL